MATWSHELYRTQWQEHVGRIAVHTVSDQGGCGWSTRARLWLCPHFILPGLPGHSMVLLTLKTCLPPQLLPHASSFPETSLHSHPTMPFPRSGHLSIHYTDKTSRLELHSSRKVAHPLANRGEQMESQLVNAAQARCTANLETMWERSSWLHRLMSGHPRT